MAIGQQYTIRIHENDAGTVVFDSVTVSEFTHVAGFAGATTVKKEDFTNNPNDAFIVQITYANGATPNQSALTVAALTIAATDAVNAVYGDGEAGAPTA